MLYVTENCFSRDVFHQVVVPSMSISFIFYHASIQQKFMESPLLTRLFKTQGVQRGQEPGPYIQEGYSDVRLLTVPMARAYVRTFFLQTRNRVQRV